MTNFKQSIIIGVLISTVGLFAISSISQGANTQTAELIVKAKIDAVKDLAKLFQNSKTIGAFLSQIDGNIDPKTRRFLAEKSKGFEKRAFTVSNTGKNSFIVNEGKLFVPLSIPEEDALGMINFEVNNHRLLFDPKQPLDVLWAHILTLLPKQQTAHNLWSFILPEANANPTVIAIVVIVLGALEYINNKANCEGFGLIADSCNERSEKNWIVFAANYYETPRVALGCSDKKDRVYQCLANKAKEPGEIGDALREFYRSHNFPLPTTSAR